jgi:hypothetical protein
MEWCMTMVSVADLVVRLPGESKGADLEVAEAKRRGIPVVHSVECVVNPGGLQVDAAPAMVEMGIKTLRQVCAMLRCIQRPTVPYDKDALAMAQAAVGYCGEMAARIEALLPKNEQWKDSE